MVRGCKLGSALCTFVAVCGVINLTRGLWPVIKKKSNMVCLSDLAREAQHTTKRGAGTDDD